MIRSSATIHPGNYVIASLLVTIIVGTALLALPWCRATSISLLDLFTVAVSCCTVTGFMPIPVESFTAWGHFIMMILIQLGGIGIMTMSLLFISFIMEMGISTQFIGSELLEIQAITNVRRTLLFIVVFTLLAEFAGWLTLLPFFASTYDLSTASFASLFHAISSFCNAGVVIPLTEKAVVPHSYWPLLMTMGLMAAGGFGFITWQELYRKVRNKLRGNPTRRLSLQSKIVISMTFLLLFISTLTLSLLEWNHTFAQYPWYQKIFYAMFMAVSAKSTGFMITPLATWTAGSLLLILVMTFIGSSPGSTGSGIKTTTVAIIGALIKSVLQGSHEIQLANRRISNIQAYKAVTIAILQAMLIALAWWLLILTKDGRITATMVEAVSAVTNLGVSIESTDAISNISKIIINIAMIIGRIGAFTICLSFIKPRRLEFSYPEERVMLT